MVNISYNNVSKPVEGSNVKDRFFNWNTQEEVGEGEFKDVVPPTWEENFDQQNDNTVPDAPSFENVAEKPQGIDISEDRLPQEAGFSVDLSPDEINVFQDAGYASDKAAKYDFALGQDSPGKDKIQSDLELGQDNYLRDSMAQKKSIELQEQRISMIREQLANSERPLTSEEVDGIVYLSKSKPNVDPNSIFEEAYGDKFTEQVTKLPEGKEKFKEAVQDASDEVLDGLDAVASIVAKREMVNDLTKDLEQRTQSQSTMGLVGDYAKQFLPLYSYGNLTDQGAGAVTPKAARGQNREENYEYFRTLSPSRFKKEFKAAYERIAESNLLDAAAFLEGYNSYSTADATIDDTLGYLDWAAVPGLAVASRSLLQGGARRLAQGRGPKIPGESATEAPTVPTPTEGPKATGGDAAPTAPQAPPRPSETFTVVPQPQGEAKKHTSYDTKTKTLTVDPEAVKADWAKKPWKKYGLDDSEFLTPDDWYNFWVERYKVSSFLNRKDYSSKEDFAKAINDAALGSLKSGQKNQEIKGVLKDTAKAAQHSKIEDALAQVGEIDTAAAVTAHKRIKEVFDGKDQLGDGVDLKNRTVSLFYPHEQFLDPGSLSRKQAEILKAKALNSAAKLLEIPTNNAAVVRMTPEATDAAINVAKAQIQRDYNHLGDAVLDVDLGGAFNVITPEQQLVNVYTLEYRLGKITKKAPEAPKAPKTPEAPKADLSETDKIKYQIAQLEKFPNHSKEQPQAKSRVATALERLEKRPGDWVELTEFRKQFPKQSKADLDKVLQEKYRNKEIDFTLEEDQKTLTDERRAASFKLGNEEMHLVRRKDSQSSPTASPVSSGDETLDTINKYTAVNGRMLVRDLYDQMKRDGAYKGSLAGFRQYVGKLNAEKKVTTSLFEGKIPAPAAALRKSARLDEEGNFASNFKRDQNYGNETYRNRIIDSEYVYKKETQFTSARRFHYIEPSSTNNAASAAPPSAPKTPVSFTPANPSRVSDLEASVTDLLGKLRKAPNPRLHDRLTKLQARLETRARIGLSEDIRGPGAQMNTSPYQEEFTSLTRRKIELKPTGALEKAYLKRSGGKYEKPIDIADLKEDFPNLSLEEFHNRLREKQRNGELFMARYDDPSLRTDKVRSAQFPVRNAKGELVDNYHVIEFRKPEQPKTKEQIELSDVDRNAPRDRTLSDIEKEKFKKLETEVYQHVAAMNAKRPTRTPKEEPYVIEKKLGKPTAELFKSPSQAANYGTRLYGLSPNQFRIRQQGSGYYISIPKVVDETVPEARHLMTTTTNKSDEGFANAFAGYILTPDGQLGELQNANRKLATYAPGEMHRVMQEAAEEIRQLPYGERDELDKIWKANRDIIIEDEKKGPLRGKFYETQGEFEREFSKRFNKLPSLGQRSGYFEYVRLYDTDYVLRNLALHRDLGRLGLEKTRIFSHFDNDGQIDTMPSKWFAARSIDELPLGDTGEDWGIFVYDDTAKGGNFYLRSQLTRDILDDIQTKQKDHGYKLLELGNPLEKPLRSVIGNDETANFALVRSFEKVKYDWGTLPYRPGGHVAYDQKHFTKQPRIRRTDASGVKRNVYEGDTSFLAHDSEAEARQVSSAMDKARLMLKGGTPDAQLEDYLHRNTPYDLKQFKGFFEERQLPSGEVVPPKAHIDDAFTHTYSGRNTFDMAHFKSAAEGYENFTDAIRSKYNIFANGVDKKYLGARDPDLPAVEIGNGETPMMTLTKPRLIDPLDTINSSLANAIRSKYLNDYKASATESFIQEFSDVMKVQGGREELRRNPVYYLHNPPWDTETDNIGKLRAAKNFRRATINFLGTDSPIAENVGWVQQKMVNAIYDNFGAETANKVVAKKWLPFEKDPITFLRGIAFHEKLGLFNIKQYFTQAQSLANIAAIEGWGSALGAMPKTFAARRLALTEDENVVRGVVQKLGLQDTDFLEAYTELKKTGFYNIGGETASRDDYFDPKVFSGPLGTFLEKGTFFFKEGERLGRLNAWFAAYSTWRNKNPGKVMTNSDRNLVLNRADTLMVNQSRASNAALQQGLGSVPTQFYSYQWRLAELLLGKRISTPERIRAFTTYGALYGIPVGLSAGVAIPFYDDVRQAFMERGVNMDDKQIQLFHDGIISTGLSVATGEQYNVSQTYGPQGLSVIKDIAQGDKTLIDLVIGAGGSVVIDNLKALGVGVDYLHSLFTFDQKDGPTVADLIDVTKNISSVNSALQAWMMYNTGRYVSKSGTIITKDSTSADVFMQAMLGLQKNEVGDTFRMIESLKEQKEYEEVARKEVLKYYRQSLRARETGDTQQAEIALNKARAALIAGGFRPDQYGEILRRAAQQNESLFESMQKEFVKKAPPSQYRDRLDNAIEYNKNNNER